MKAAKGILWVLAGAWIVLLMLEKSSGAAGAFLIRNKPWPHKAGHYFVRFLKSMILTSLVLINIFMALSLIGGTKK